MEPPEPRGGDHLEAAAAYESDREETPSSTVDPPPESSRKLPEDEISPSPSSLRRRRPHSKSAFISANPKERRTRALAADSGVSVTADASSSTLASGQTKMSIPAPTIEPQTKSLLDSVADLMIKAIFFQINLLISSFTFPIWLLRGSLLLATDPFGALRRGRDGVRERLSRALKFLLEEISPLVKTKLGGHGKTATRLVLGCFWSLYVGLVLVGLLAVAFLAGWLLMARVVEEPVRVVEGLSFDYTKSSPDALVPLVPSLTCDGLGCGLDCGGKDGSEAKILGWRPLPMNRKLQLTISLTLPESDYNRKLGMFQVRAEFLSANGKVTSSSSQPCMLRFKSSQIRLIESFLKSGTLLAGYSSESQILVLKLTGFAEGIEPTVCIRVILEQRAEYRPASGIPEIYSASLRLESQLPLFKRIVWNWRRTVFTWISLGLFVWELLVVLVCCRTVVLPRAMPSPSART